MYPEETATMGLRPRPSKKGVSYPTENGLRYEQSLPTRLSYKPINEN
jgi:hypothetical protein